MVRMVGVIASIIDRGGRGNGVDVRGHAVLMLRVLVARIRVHVLERCRPGGREHRANHEKCGGSEHHAQCMSVVLFRQKTT